MTIATQNNDLFPEQPFCGCMEDFTGRKAVVDSYRKEIDACSSGKCLAGTGYGSLARLQLMGGLCINGSIDFSKMIIGLSGGICRCTCATGATICCPVASLCSCCSRVRKDADVVSKCWKDVSVCFGLCGINSLSFMERTVGLQYNLFALEGFNSIGQITCWKGIERYQALSSDSISCGNEGKISRALCSESCCDLTEEICNSEDGMTADDGCCDAFGECCVAVCGALCSGLGDD